MREYAAPSLGGNHSPAARNFLAAFSLTGLKREISAMPSRTPRPARIKRSTDHIDICIAAHLVALRCHHGLTQQELARALDISYQQVQKYEYARNRITASTLYRIARIFNVPVHVFFVGLPD
jgi:DNA-binding XRE family transcriptional regulator